MTDHATSGRRIGGGSVSLCLALVLCGASYAAERPKAFDGSAPAGTFDLSASAGPTMTLVRPAPGQGLAPLRRVVAGGFLSRHLLPGMSQQLGRIAPILSLEVDRSSFERSGMHGWFAGVTGRHVNRGARKAIRDYLYEETAVGNFVESMRVGRHGLGRPEEGQARDYGFNVVRGVPRVEMRQRSSAGTTHVDLGVEGSVSVGFQPRRLPDTRVSAAYDADRSSVRLTFRHGF